MKNPAIKQLKKMQACKKGIEWFKKNKKSTLEETILYADYEGLGYANWYIAHSFNSDNKVRYAIYAAEKVLHIYEENYQNDKRPQDAIKAAKKWIKNSTKKNSLAAYAAYAAASAAAYAAASAAASAASAASAAYAAYAAASAAYAAASAASAAYAAASAAAYAAASVADVAYAAKEKTLRNIVNYGLELLETRK